MRYVALLRGINVGGHKIIPMARLRSIFESSGFANVTTYIQSGNVLFDSTLRTSKSVRTKVESMLRHAFSYDIVTMVRMPMEMKKIVAGNPFTAIHAQGKTKCYVAFLEATPAKQERESVLELQRKGMSLHFGKCELYILLDAKFTGSNSPFSNSNVEKILRQRSTVRNWATTCRLLDMSSS